MDKEVFKDIKGYENLYLISNLGNVISLPKGDGNGNRKRILKKDISKRKSTTYNRVTLCKEGITKRFLVHRLVALHFIPNPLNKPFVNHIDNNGENNNVNNLEWCTHSENMIHAEKQGRLTKAQRKGLQKQKEMFEEKMFNKMVSIFKDRPFKIKYVELNSRPRKYVFYKCFECGKDTKCRTDSVLVLVKNGICNNCSRRLSNIA